MWDDKNLSTPYKQNPNIPQHRFPLKNDSVRCSDHVQININERTGITREIMTDVADNAMAPLEPMFVVEVEGVLDDTTTAVVATRWDDREGWMETGMTGVVEENGAVVNDAMKILELDGTLVTLLVLPALLAPGASTASEGFTRAPWPHGMLSPVSGWVALGGGVVAPAGSEIANRVVQVLSEVWLLVNW